jgi:hypothetical protein
MEVNEVSDEGNMAIMTIYDWRPSLGYVTHLTQVQEPQLTAVGVQ